MEEGEIQTLSRNYFYVYRQFFGLTGIICAAHTCQPCLK